MGDLGSKDGVSFDRDGDWVFSVLEWRRMRDFLRLFSEKMESGEGLRGVL